MNWQDIGEFNPKEHGTDALLLKMALSPYGHSIMYGWYDPEASESHPWRFIDDHGAHNENWDAINVNGAPPLGTVVAFIPFSNLPK